MNKETFEKFRKLQEAKDPVIEKLDAVIELFTDAMSEKVFLKYVEDGYKGWDDQDGADVLLRGFEDHIEEGENIKDRSEAMDNYVDIANFCLFLWNLEREAPKIEHTD